MMKTLREFWQCVKDVIAGAKRNIAESKGETYFETVRNLLCIYMLLAALLLLTVSIVGALLALLILILLVLVTTGAGQIILAVVVLLFLGAFVHAHYIFKRDKASEDKEALH